jgi:Lrp/AsnC family transcriptional regulator, leucine-responsive regulatory protein
MLDEIDKHILRELSKDARMSIAELSHRVGLSPTPCARRLRQLETAGVVTGYTVVTNNASMGMDAEALALVRLGPVDAKTSERFEAAVALLPEIRDCYVVSGPSDYLLHIVCRNLADYEKFLKQHVRTKGLPMEIQTMIVLKKVTCIR